MFYLNDSLPKLAARIMPDTYVATSIDDFVKNAETIPKPSHWKKILFNAYVIRA